MIREHYETMFSFDFHGQPKTVCRRDTIRAVRYKNLKCDNKEGINYSICLHYSTRFSLLGPFTIAKLTQLSKRFVLFQELQLFVVEGASSLASDQKHGVVGFHACLQQSNSNQDWRSSQPGNTMNPNTIIARRREDLETELQKLLDRLVRRPSTVFEGPVVHLDAVLLEQFRRIARLTHTNQRSDVVALKVRNVRLQRVLGRHMSNEEVHLAEIDVTVRRTKVVGRGTGLGRASRVDQSYGGRSRNGVG